MPFHVMIVPTLGCPSKCSCCWSSEEGSPIMSMETIKETVKWLKDFRKDPVTFTFHGGEPLLAGADFYRQALPLLALGLAHLKPAFALQTNLWKMTAELAKILAEYDIPIGSNLDGPEELTDLQRGKGYYRKTLPGLTHGSSCSGSRNMWIRIAGIANTSNSAGEDAPTTPWRPRIAR